MEVYTLSWDNAQAFCVAKAGGGWNLVTIRSSLDEVLLKSQIATWPWENTWIGLAVPLNQRNQNGMAHSGKFVWADGSTSSYRHWWPGEPNNYGGGKY